MLRGATTGLLRASSSAGKWQQCLKLSTTKIINSASAATPEPQTSPPILYTGVSFLCIFSIKEAINMQS